METPLYAVVGNPILHSKSPSMHNEVLSQCSSSYIRIHAEKFSDIITLSREFPLKGVNVTAPFKEDAYRICTQMTEEAKKLKAVNTLVFHGNEIFGANTDVFGVSESLKEARVFDDSLSYLVIGAGGAARSVLSALNGKKATLTNRSLQRGEQCAREWSVEFIPLSEISFEYFDVIISTVSDPSFFIPQGQFTSRHVFFNALYKDSTMSKCAQNAGSLIIPGERWLLHQAERAAQYFYGEGEYGEIFQRGLSLKRKQNNSIALIGMMGSGKSEVAKKLSELSALPLYDLDAEVEKKAGTSIPQIFLEHGVHSFRETESMCLKCVPLESPIILATGGGVILSQENRGFLKENFTTVWLYASEKTLSKRLLSELHTRPILRTASIADIHSERMPLYAESSDIVFYTDEHDIESVAEMIYRECV